ncbi:hypothetical protein JCM5350_004360 [Sporobolomyces pararoseus]
MDSSAQPPPSLPFSLTGAGQLRQELQLANRYTIVWLTILLFDHIATFDSELLNIWQSDVGMFKLFFLLNRYGSLILVGMASALTLASVPLDVCRRIVWIAPLSGIFVVLICDIIMSLRIDALYGRNRTIRSLLALAVVAEFTIMVVLSTRLDPLVLPRIAAEITGFEGCTIKAKDPSQAGVITATFWTAPLVVATLFLGLTLYRSFKAMRGSTRMPLYERFVVGQLKYFVVIAATHLVNVALITPSIVLTSVCSSRLVLGLYDSNEIPTIRSTRTVTTLETWGSSPRKKGSKNSRDGELVFLREGPFSNPQSRSEL